MATIQDFGIPGVGTGINHPKLKHKWRITFANLGGGADSQMLSMQAITATRPQINFEPVQMDRYNSRAFVAGKHTFEPLTLVFEDDLTNGAARAIQAQIQKQQWLTGAEGQWLASAGEGSSYKFTTYLDILDGNDQVIERWTMEGCWILGVDYTDLDYAASESVKINITLRFDHARQDLEAFSYSGGRDGSGQGTAV